MLALALVLALSASPAPAVRSGDHVDFPIDPKDPALGPATAPVTIIELLDFQCPYCRGSEPAFQKLLAEHKDHIRLIHKDFPLDIHQRAFAAAEAARCAGEQGRFWEMRRALLQRGQRLQDEDVAALAASLKLSASAFGACVASNKYEAPVTAAVNDALSRGFHVTPSYIVNGRAVVGAQPSLLRRVVEEALRPAP